jgi:hypothetical protein
VKRLASINPKKAERILEPQPCGRNREYRQVKLFVDRVGAYFRIHCLVMDAFVGACPTGLEVNHKNGVPTDNRLDNLEYMTRSENRLHALHELGVGNIKLDDDKVLAIKHMIAAKVLYSAIAAQFSISRATVVQIQQGITWKHVTLQQGSMLF